MSASAPEIYGVMAEFETPEAAAAAARAAREQGFHQLDAFGPFPSEELTEAIGFRENKVALCVLLGGIAGGLTGFALQYWATVLDYPHNIGGRPDFSWPSFIPIIFELIVLFATLTGIVSLFVLNRLPRLEHPTFRAPEFLRASIDHFYLCIRPGDESFSTDKARDFLATLAPLSITILHEETKP